jgi:hypothetical protein
LFVCWCFHDSTAGQYAESRGLSYDELVTPDCKATLESKLEQKVRVVAFANSGASLVALADSARYSGLFVLDTNKQEFVQYCEIEGQGKQVKQWAQLPDVRAMLYRIETETSLAEMKRNASQENFIEESTSRPHTPPVSVK